MIVFLTPFFQIYDDGFPDWEPPPSDDDDVDDDLNGVGASKTSQLEARTTEEDDDDLMIVSATDCTVCSNYSLFVEKLVLYRLEKDTVWWLR